MSLVRIALRMTAVLALKDQTLANDNVLDSEIGVLSEGAEGLSLHKKHKSKRFIAVYTDEAESTPDELRGFHDNGEVNLSIEFGVTDSMVIEEDDPDDSEKRIRSVIPGIPFTNRMPELYLDLLSKQIRNVLSGGDNAAAEVFRSLVNKVLKIKVERAGSAREGERIAAQKLTLTLDVLDDPQFSEDVEADLPMGRFFELLENGTSDDQKLAALMRAQLPSAPEGLEETQTRIGLILSEMQALGFKYIEYADETSTAQSVTIEVDGAAPVEVAGQ
ncbi:MAG: hypothetical protein ABJL55_16350 [Roseibium sp.]